MKLMDDNKTIAGTNMGHLFHRIDLLRPQAEELLQLYEAGQIKPHVDRTFRFDEAAGRAPSHPRPQGDRQGSPRPVREDP